MFGLPEDNYEIGQIPEGFETIKRRTVANEACDAEKVIVNGKAARASYEVKVGDIIEILIGKPLKVRVLDVREFTKKEEAAALYEVV